MPVTRRYCHYNEVLIRVHHEMTFDRPGTRSKTISNCGKMETASKNSFPKGGRFFSIFKKPMRNIFLQRTTDSLAKSYELRCLFSERGIVDRWPSSPSLANFTRIYGTAILPIHYPMAYDEQRK
ncbi:hypothetical protein Bhyg_10430 [Pseudolycoriella hygida]|uniref:Uncharacterized protein n=1 Tax=Pseudolycoriella hygida TaxID=35572 RepID=A0A9Q0MUZ6_9DIPT|nr:hypothetical protein Bhyg_10430 [Pseudolycoriella hygida]